MTHQYRKRSVGISRHFSKVIFVCAVISALFVVSLNVNKDMDFGYGQSAQALTPTSYPANSYLSRVDAHDLMVNGKSLTGAGVVIGIYDGGVNLDNSAFVNTNGSSRIISQACFGDSTEINKCNATKNRQVQNTCFTNDVGCFHGMSVAGFAAGKSSVVNLNGQEVEVGGIAPGAEISYIRQAMDKAGTIKHDDFIKALSKFVADTKSGSSAAPDVVNLSLSFPRSAYPNCEQDNEIKRAIDYLVNSGVTVVAATGNDSEKDSITYPACMNNVIAVGSSGISSVSNGTLNEVVSPFSNMSKEVTLVAPGEKQWGLLPEENRFVKVSGTSFAAPIVSGAVALLKEAKPSISRVEIVQVLNETGDVVIDPATGNQFKKLNVKKAILAVTPRHLKATTSKVDSVSPNISHEKVVVSEEVASQSVEPVASKGFDVGLAHISRVGSSEGLNFRFLMLFPVLGLVSLLATIMVKRRRGARYTDFDFNAEYQWQMLSVMDDLELTFLAPPFDESQRELVRD